MKIPGDLLRAYTQVELEGAAAGNPSGKLSARQKREARQAARERLEEEAKDGRFLQRRTHSILWDAASNELLVATTAQGAIDRLLTLFQQTFGSGVRAPGGRPPRLRPGRVAGSRSQCGRCDADDLCHGGLGQGAGLVAR